ncbi:Tetratricopeptide repeat [Hirschfeldia incana]|nr:Tetratricopeptide repeat [Hirschfeldia incana]
MVMIESSEEEKEILIMQEQKPSSSSSPQIDVMEAKQVDGDDSDGFETASEREIISDEEDETIQESDEADKKEEQIDLVREGEAITIKVKPAPHAFIFLGRNSLFANGLYGEALCRYVRAIVLVREFPESIELRSTFYLNRGVCFLKLGRYEETVEECTIALELNPTYSKALVRRAEAHEKLEHFEEAVTDLKKILELDPSNDQARKGIGRLEPLAAEKREKMKEEAITKLKGMGNSILGRFGMSVDNFKAVKDPNTGSYSLSFQN